MDNTKVYLVQTDTTVGFSSTDDEKLSSIKQRPITQKILQTVDSLKTLNQQTRIPKKYKKMVRKANKTTFIYPNGNSYRTVSKNSNYYNFTKKMPPLFSTSANLTGKSFDDTFAKKSADVIAETKGGFSDVGSSSIYKISKYKIKKIR